MYRDWAVWWKKWQSLGTSNTLLCAQGRPILHLTPHLASAPVCRVLICILHTLHMLGEWLSWFVRILRSTVFINLDQGRGGWYVSLLCTVSGLLCIVAGINIPPPYSSKVLGCLANFMAQFSNVPLLAVGDYNNYINHQWDKMPIPSNIPRRNGGITSFAGLLEERGLADVWHAHT